MAGAIALSGGPAVSHADVGAPAVTPSQWDILFNDVAPGQTSAERTITLTNSGTANLVVGGLKLQDPHAADFAVANDHCTSVPVAAGGTCTFGVSFKPTAVGTRLAYVRIDANTTCSVWLTLAGGGSLAPVASTRSTDCAPATPVPTATATPGGEVLGQDASGGKAVCPGRTRVLIHFHTKLHTRLASARVTVAGRTFKVTRVKGTEKKARGYYKASLNFRGLTRPTYRVKVRGKLTSGEKYKRDRIFKNCISS